MVVENFLAILAAYYETVLAFVQAKPWVIVVGFMFLRKLYTQSQPFPTVDYGTVKSLTSSALFGEAVRPPNPKEGSEGTVSVVDFYATWCPPCKAAVPVYAQMSLDYEGRGVDFYKVDVDGGARDTAKGEKVEAMPTFKVYRGGECVGTVGYGRLSTRL